MSTPPVSKADLQKAIDAYNAAGGNKSEGARMCGLPRHTYRDRLEMAEKAFGVVLGKVADGRYEAREISKRPLPPKGAVARYIITSCQNNTHPHEAGLKNLIAYGEWTKRVKKGNSFEFIVGTFSYQLDAYGAKAVKRGRAKLAESEVWYSPALVPYINDDSVMLAPGLVWCGEMNILPTATNPLTGLDDYNGRASNIVPHVKQTMESVASLPDEATKFNYSTGGITLRNYIQKRAGIVAERKHTYGGLLVEVDDAGSWYVRHLVVDDAGAVYDIGPAGYRGVRVINGIVDAIKCSDKEDKRTFTDSIMWGDVHASEMDLWVRILGWGAGGVLDQHKPKRQFWHDLFSMRSRGHHEMKDFIRTFEKYVAGEGDVGGEVAITADFMHEGVRYKARDGWDCETVVIRSNHDRHLDRWANEADPKKDPSNAVYYTKLMGAKLAAIVEGDRDFNMLEWALAQAGAPKVFFNGEDQSYVICKRSKVNPDGIECGLHGDLGANGARGSSRGLKKLGRPVNKDHDHTATMLDQRGVMSGGACATGLPYMKGPNSQSVSHIFTFENGARQIVTFWNRKHRL